MKHVHYFNTYTDGYDTYSTESDIEHINDIDEHSDYTSLTNTNEHDLYTDSDNDDSIYTTNNSDNDINEHIYFTDSDEYSVTDEESNFEQKNSSDLESDHNNISSVKVISVMTKRNTKVKKITDRAWKR